jgi:hypothetical protein
VIYKAKEISESSWLNEDRFESFRKAWGYASTQTYAIIAMANISPEDAYHLFEALKRGEEMHSDS